MSTTSHAKSLFEYYQKSTFCYSSSDNKYCMDVVVGDKIVNSISFCTQTHKSIALCRVRKKNRRILSCINTLVNLVFPPFFFCFSSLLQINPNLRKLIQLLITTFIFSNFKSHKQIY